MVTYRSEEEVSFIELAAPMNPTLKDVPLLGRSLAAVTRDLRAIAVEVVEDPSGAFVPDWGVGLYVLMDKVEGVSIGE
jgi:hypothetical protein